MKKLSNKNPNKNPATKQLKSKCDKLLTPKIKELHPHCLLCGERTEVAHHFVHKSKSLILRHEIKNLIPLCNSCHLALHHNEGYYSAKIIKIKGMKWFNWLEKQKNQVFKPDIAYYENKLKELSTD